MYEAWHDLCPELFLTHFPDCLRRMINNLPVRNKTSGISPRSRQHRHPATSQPASPSLESPTPNSRTISGCSRIVAVSTRQAGAMLEQAAGEQTERSSFSIPRLRCQPLFNLTTSRSRSPEVSQAVQIQKKCGVRGRCISNDALTCKSPALEPLCSSFLEGLVHFPRSLFSNQDSVCFGRCPSTGITTPSFPATILPSRLRPPVRRLITLVQS